jgi:hypothetical protein
MLKYFVDNFFRIMSVRMQEMTISYGEWLFFGSSSLCVITFDIWDILKERNETKEGDVQIGGNQPLDKKNKMKCVIS